MDEDETQSYIRRLLLTLQRVNRENKDLQAEVLELKNNVSRVRSDMQDFLRYELKKEEKVAYAEVPINQ
jgi:predicted  nucleic acid-binding Zn-ribbon protein